MSGLECRPSPEHLPVVYKTNHLAVRLGGESPDGVFDSVTIDFNSDPVRTLETLIGYRSGESQQQTMLATHWHGVRTMIESIQRGLHSNTITPGSLQTVITDEAARNRALVLIESADILIRTTGQESECTEGALPVFAASPADIRQERNVIPTVATLYVRMGGEEDDGGLPDASLTAPVTLTDSDLRVIDTLVGYNPDSYNPEDPGSLLVQNWHGVRALVTNPAIRNEAGVINPAALNVISDRSARQRAAVQILTVVGISRILHTDAWVDSDGDGIMNDQDLCRDETGNATNRGCPETYCIDQAGQPQPKTGIDADSDTIDVACDDNDVPLPPPSSETLWDRFATWVGDHPVESILSGVGILIGAVGAYFGYRALTRQDPAEQLERVNDELRRNREALQRLEGREGNGELEAERNRLQREIDELERRGRELQTRIESRNPNPAPVDPAPVDPAPVDPAPAEAVSYEPERVDRANIEGAACVATGSERHDGVIEVTQDAEGRHLVALKWSERFARAQIERGQNLAPIALEYESAVVLEPGDVLVVGEERVELTTEGTFRTPIMSVDPRMSIDPAEAAPADVVSEDGFVRRSGFSGHPEGRDAYIGVREDGSVVVEEGRPAEGSRRVRMKIHGDQIWISSDAQESVLVGRGDSAVAESDIHTWIRLERGDSIVMDGAEVIYEGPEAGFRVGEGESAARLSVPAAPEAAVDPLDRALDGLPQDSAVPVTRDNIRAELINRYEVLESPEYRSAVDAISEDVFRVWEQEGRPMETAAAFEGLPPEDFLERSMERALERFAERDRRTAELVRDTDRGRREDRNTERLKETLRRAREVAEHR